MTSRDQMPPCMVLDFPDGAEVLPGADDAPVADGISWPALGLMMVVVFLVGLCIGGAP